MADKFIIDADELQGIWLDAGPHPEYHREVKAKLKKEWPLLYGFIDKIVTRHVDLKSKDFMNQSGYPFRR